MEICYDDDGLREYMEKAVNVSPDHPVLIDRFLEDAFEFDVDAVCDGTDVFIGGVMQHIEEAGVHSGDSCCVLPPYAVTAAAAADADDVHPPARARAQGGRTDQRAVCDARRRDLRPRGEPPRFAHRAVRQQGHRRPAGEDRREADGRQDAEGAGRPGVRLGQARRGQGIGLPVPEVSRRHGISSARRCARPAR